MAEKYKIEETRYAGGTREVTVTRQPTAGDYIAGGAVVAGMLGSAVRSSQQKTAIRQAEAAVKLMDDGKVDDAIVNANALIQTNDKEAKVLGHYLKGLAFRIDENNIQAIEEFSWCIRLAEEADVLQSAAGIIGYVFSARGSCYLETGELSKALNDFTRLTQLLPQDDNGYYWRGRALRSLGDLDQALTNLNRAIELNPSDGANYRERGQIQAAKHDTQKALDDYNRAITLDAKDASAFQLRGQLYTSLGDYQKAIADYSEAIRLAPNNVELYKLRAEAHRLAGNTDASEADLARVAQEEPLQRAFTDYLKAARSMTAQGIKITYTQSDTRARWSMKTILVSIVLGLVIGGCSLFFAVQMRDEFAFWGSLAIPIVVTLVGVLGARGEAKKKRRLSNLYISSIAENEKRMPGFEEFFKQYLQARKDGAMQNLSATTRRLFEMRGPAHPALARYRS